LYDFLPAGGKWERAGLIEHYDWEWMSEGGLVVELGGSVGDMCIDLARAYPQIWCNSQDLPEAVAGVVLPDDVKGRVEVVAHDFFTEQSVKAAGVYLFRWIFHGWSDKYAIRSLKNLRPALRKGAWVCLNRGLSRSLLRGYCGMLIRFVKCTGLTDGLLEEVIWL
jgi:hypothetical protein